MSWPTVEILLAQGAESDELDFKTSVDFSARKYRVDIAKDVGAMQAQGGHLLFGVDDDGKIVNALDSAQEKYFDAACMSDQLKEFLASGFRIRTKWHTRPEGNVGVIYVHPHRAVLAPFQKNGEYKNNDGVTTKCVFKEGEIFTRRNTQSVRMLLDDVLASIELIRKRIRAEESEARSSGSNPDFIQSGSIRNAAALVMNGETSAFETAIETVGLSDLPTRDFIALIETVRRVAYREIRSLEPPQKSPGPSLLKEILVLAYLFGSQLIERKAWPELRELSTSQPPNFSEHRDHYPYWYAEDTVVASRSNLLNSLNEVSLITEALSSSNLALFDTAIPSDPELLLDLLTQVDLLLALTTLLSPFAGPIAYIGGSSFWLFEPRRSDPILRTLLTSEDMRKSLFPDVSTSDLRVALRRMEREVSRQAPYYSPWDYFEDPLVRDFMDD